MSRRIRTKASLPQALHLAVLAAGAGACALLLAAAQPAGAQDYLVYYPNSKTFHMAVTATVGTACGFADGGAPTPSTQDVGDVNDPFSKDFTFTMECTGPFRMAVQSLNGYLKAPAPADGLPAGYTNLAPYKVALEINGDGGSQAKADCTASDLLPAGSCSFLGPSSSTQGLLLNSAAWDVAGKLTVHSSGYTGSDVLIAAPDPEYKDILTITVSLVL